MIGSGLRSRQLVLQSAVLLNVALLSLRAAHAEEAKPKPPTNRKLPAKSAAPKAKRVLVAQAAPAPVPPPPAAPPPAAAPPAAAPAEPAPPPAAAAPAPA